MGKKRFKTKKALGQHLLIAQGIIQRIVDFMEIDSNDVIVEIGVGTGQLTEEILRRNPKILYGIEIDDSLYTIIEERFTNFGNFILIKKDYFDVNIRELVKLNGKDKIKVVGNLPYNVASLIIIDMVFKLDLINSCVFMVQKEVAEKIVSKSGNKSFSFITVFIQTFFNVEYKMSIPARFFSPPPKVTSALIKLTPKNELSIPFNLKEIVSFKNFVSSLFANRRKMLRSKIDGELLIKVGLKPTSRVEELNLEDFINLYKVYKERI